jgi:uncharacterized protein YbjT (DUF2867 family)
LGGAICRLLRSGGRQTRALVRPTSDPRRTETLSELGVELVKGDLKDRWSGLPPADDLTLVLVDRTR